MKSIVRKIIKTNSSSYKRLFNEKGKIYTFLNPVSYLIAHSNKEKFRLFDGIFADGGILSFFIKIYYKRIVERRSFDMTSVASILLNYAERNMRSICFIGATEEDNKTAMNKIRVLFPLLKIVGSRNGFFKNEIEKKEAIAEIIKLNPDYLIIGMGTPLQEDFLLLAKEMGYKGIGFTCGGFIHQVAQNKLDYYPGIIDKLNLRWVYRFAKERHTRCRYLESAFVFPYQFAIDYFGKEYKTNTITEIGEAADLDINFHYKLLDSQSAQEKAEMSKDSKAL